MLFDLVVEGAVVVQLDRGGAGAGVAGLPGRPLTRYGPGKTARSASSSAASPVKAGVWPGSSRP